MNIEKIRELSLLYASGSAPAQKIGKQGHPNKQKTKASVYRAYMASPEWEAFRKSIFRQRGRRCEDCRTLEGQIELHHLTYVRFGHEKPEDVRVLCEGCHTLRHPKGKRRRRPFVDWFASSLEASGKARRKV